MRSIETSQLLKVALDEGIVIEYWDFPPPLEAVYLFEPGLPPNIGLSKRILETPAYFRCVLAEELGHHFTTVGPCISRQTMSYHERLNVSKVEYKAMKWAAEFLIPFKDIKRAVLWECYWTQYHLAEYFDVTLEMIKFRLGLPDVIELVKYTKAAKYG
ncbi:ImmA/IrrE family metallo-endopeptidase [Bacillus badius]|uniref:ImmA/IrrE family metallo-endopeptidase n=1 Tax=Bacillus badius TaxID=1455 RepID=UPI001CBAA6A2|nr:ImmA/IrrE family metallo-endopeptidase [Bacillus badius]UAT31923.1 ImmA/IrrE family metallo-endopeptidase [Bacillus badius]